MKNKIIIFLSLAVLFLPAVSRATIMVPTINLTTTVNTHGQDSSFHFNLNSCSGVFCNNSAQFDLQTQNLSGSRTISFFPEGDRYILTETNIAGLKVSDISCTSTDSNATFSYDVNEVYFRSVPWSSVSCTFNNKGKTPVLIVPGLLGTEIKDGQNFLWIDPVKIVTSITDDFMDSLGFNNNLMPSSSSLYAGQVIKKEPFFDYTDGLIKEFVGQGYTENQDLFTFPYDWRYGASGKFADGTSNADLFAQKIQDILAQTGASKVDVVAHSLGGLIVKEYAMAHPTDNHIGKAVFVGVPNTGSPKAVKVLLQGDNLDVPGLNDQEIKKISQNMPAVYDLLPSQKYYDEAGSFVSLLSYLDNSQNALEKDLNYQEFENYLVHDKNLNSLALSSAGNFHAQSFDDFDLRTAGVDLYAIDGCKTGTMAGFVEGDWKDSSGNNVSVYDNVELKIGDGTVPIQSSTNLPIDHDNKYYALVSDHSKMPSEDGIRQEIVNLISGSNLSTGADFWGNDLITQDISRCNLNGKAISVFSPINVFVTDQNGNKMGLADDGSIINEIPNADFEILGDHKFVYLPQDEGEVYNINMQGIGNGTYTIKSQDISNSQITKTEVFSNLPVTPALTGSVNFNSAGNTTSLTVKQTPTSQTQIITPSATVDAAASEDVLPPISTVTLTGDLPSAGIYKSNVAVKIKATDNNSGILAVGYKLDGANYSKTFGGEVSFNVSAAGVHTIKYFSTDNSGNNELEKTIIFTINKTIPVLRPPLIASPYQ